jgi:hypothetical protein
MIIPLFDPMAKWAMLNGKLVVDCMSTVAIEE